MEITQYNANNSGYIYLWKHTLSMIFHFSEENWEDGTQEDIT